MAKPSASVDDAQAVTTTCAGPLAPSAMAMLPAPSLAISSGIASGESRSGPRSKRILNDSPVTSSPPMPLPSIVPTRSMSGRNPASPSTPWRAKPASFQASTAAATAYFEKSAILRASFLSSKPPPIAYSSKFLSSAATWQVQREGSNFVMRPMPGFPALTDSQVAALPLPTAVSIPMPVIITFFMFFLFSLIKLRSLYLLAAYRFGHVQ